MNKLLKKILFICTFSYIFSIKVTNIEPTNVILGENVEFALTVEDYTSDHNHFHLGDDNDNNKIYIYCLSNNDYILICKANITFFYEKYSNNLTKNLYVNNIRTDLTITINLPSSLKILEMDRNSNKSYYAYGITNFYFKVNYNKLYNSSVSIKFGDISINCKISNDYIHNLNCFHEFPESYGNKTLDLTINNQTTGYSITLKIYPEFSLIYTIEEKLYTNSKEQLIYIGIDSSKNFEKHSIVLVPQNPNNKNITLSSCKFENDSIYYEYYNTFNEYGNCSAVLNTF